MLNKNLNVSLEFRPRVNTLQTTPAKLSSQCQGVLIQPGLNFSTDTILSKQFPIKLNSLIQNQARSNYTKYQPLPQTFHKEHKHTKIERMIIGQILPRYEKAPMGRQHRRSSKVSSCTHGISFSRESLRRVKSLPRRQRFRNFVNLRIDIALL